MEKRHVSERGGPVRSRHGTGFSYGRRALSVDSVWRHLDVAFIRSFGALTLLALLAASCCRCDNAALTLRRPALRLPRVTIRHFRTRVATRL